MKISSIFVAFLESMNFNYLHILNNGRHVFFYSLWDPEEVDKVIGKPSVKLSLLRDPVDAFESGFVYMGIGKYHKSGKEIDINEYANQILMLRYPTRAPKGKVFQ